MIETATLLPPRLGAAQDFDLDLDGAWVGLFRRADGVSLIHSRRFAPFQVSITPESPRVRWFGGDRVLVTDARSSGVSPNGHIFSSSGEALVAFDAGDGVQDVVPFGDLFAVTYFDEGVFGTKAPANQGVAVFDREGNYSWGYAARLGAEAVEVADCYCACRHGEDRLAFSPYTSFPLVELNLRTGAQNVVVLPEALHGATALSTHGKHTYFFGTYASKDRLFRWAPGEEPVDLGRHVGPLRGIGSGRFIATSERGFTLIQPDED
jgi:hypothetical protein